MLKSMDTLVALCKNRGFIYPGSEIYGGLANTWDYGPLGNELKNNVKAAWRKKFIQEQPNIVGLDAAILMNPETWVASGHVGGFSDPLIDCKECKTRHRADKLIEEWAHEHGKDMIADGMTDEEFQKVKAEMNEPIDFKFGKGIAIFDGVFTLLMVALILAGKLPTNLGFGLGFVILLFVNYPKVNDQKEYIKRNAPTAFEMAFTMLGVGVLVGINGQTGAMNELADTIVANLPTGSITWILLVFCIFSLPLSMVFGNAKGAVLVPALVSVLAGSGLTPVQIMPPTWAAGMVAANLSLFNASPYLALGLAGVEMKDHLKYSFLPCWGFSIMTTVFMLLIGKLPL